MVGNSVSLHNFHVLKAQAQGLSINTPNNLNTSFSHFELLSFILIKVLSSTF
jgi:hypothetical protein